ncbi:hypothetical protein OsccyDRAFT_1316 [Leptolyngbyaceae cyanobacterium JSC-12]|nr:hypothetical protein OsccyDRAFT_1316 [Leptolyngbyaceae cyanobacterium JSC-12]
MTKHYILSLDPMAKYEWERCTLRDPITAEHPALAEIVAKAVGDRAGSYLVAVNIEVRILEEAAIQSNSVPNLVEVPSRPQHAQLAELVA